MNIDGNISSCQRTTIEVSKESLNPSSKEKHAFRLNWIENKTKERKTHAAIMKTSILDCIILAFYIHFLSIHHSFTLSPLSLSLSSTDVMQPLLKWSSSHSIIHWHTHALVTDWRWVVFDGRLRERSTFLRNKSSDAMKDIGEADKEPSSLINSSLLSFSTSHRF